MFGTLLGTRLLRGLHAQVILAVVMAVVSVGLSQPSSAAATEQGTITVTSAAGDPWTDASGGSGTAALTYGHGGCVSLDANSNCTDGSWDTIEGAPYIWKTQLVSADEARNGESGVVFSKEFSLPATATDITAKIQINADDYYELYLNGVLVGKNGTHWNIETYTIHPVPGANTIKVSVGNRSGCADAGCNPAGLTYKAVITCTSCDEYLEPPDRTWSSPQTCLPHGTQLPSPVILPAIDVRVKLDKPIGISYGQLPLTFTSVRPRHQNSLCSLVSNAGALPVILRVHDPIFGREIARRQIASSVTTATLDFFYTGIVEEPQCDFSLLKRLSREISFSTIPLPDSVHDCYLNGPSTALDSITARWHIPGFAEYVPNANGVRLYTTQPLTYYVDLDSLLGPGYTDDLGSVVQKLESYIHRKLVANLPAVDKIGIVQDPPAHVLVTDPLGRQVGWSPQGAVDFPGSGYLEVGDRSLAWILDPVAGPYTVDAIAPPGQSYSLEVATIDLLGRGDDPSITSAVTTGTVPKSGVSRHTYAMGFWEFPWSGVLKPINPNGTSVFRRGESIPVKFQLTGASNGITNGLFKLYRVKLTNGTAGTEVAASSTSRANVGNTFRYDPTLGQYIFNLSTTGLDVGTYQLRIDLGDGVTHTVSISLR